MARRQVVYALWHGTMSGEDLRAEIKAEAEVELKKAEAEWHKRLKEINEKVDATRHEIASYVEGEQEQVENEAE